MLRSFKELRGFAIRATDGRMGTVSDVYSTITAGRCDTASSTPANGLRGDRCSLALAA